MPETWKVPEDLTRLLFEINAVSCPTLFDLCGAVVRCNGTVVNTITASNITLCNGIIILAQGADMYGPLLLIEGNDILFENIEIHGGRRGISVRPGGSVALRNCVLRGMLCGLHAGNQLNRTTILAKKIFAREQRATLTAYRVRVIGCKGASVLLSTGADVELKECEISGGLHMLASIHVTSRDTYLRAVRSSCTGGKGYELVCSNGGRAVLTDCAFSNVHVQDTPSVLEFKVPDLNERAIGGWEGGRAGKPYDVSYSVSSSVMFQNVCETLTHFGRV